MSRICYNPKLSFGEETGALLAHSVRILDDYEARGYCMTLRQLYYQLVSEALIPNNLKAYNRLKDIVRRGRLAGYIDWEQIEDRTRNLEELPNWKRAESILATARDTFRLDTWHDQERMVEVWIEKDALVGNIADTCDELRIPYFSCRGYTSISEMWRASQRIARRMVDKKQVTIILHLGDHDPSGIDMTRDIEDRLAMFVNHDVGFSIGHTYIQPVIRLALNMEQIEEFNPPPNPAKFTDSRAPDYIAKFGYESWELDALSPEKMNELIRESWQEYVDHDKWEATLAREEEQRKVLIGMVDNFDKIGKAMKRWKK